MISHSVFRNNTQGRQTLVYIGGVLTKKIKPKIIANDLLMNVFSYPESW